MSDILGLLQGQFKKALTNQISFIEGKVIKTNPLNIEVIGNTKWVIPQELILVPQTLTDHPQPVELNIPNPQGGEPIKVDSLTIKNSLKVGDKVMMVAFNLMQRYYILDRLG